MNRPLTELLELIEELGDEPTVENMVMIWSGVQKYKTAIKLQGLAWQPYPAKPCEEK